MQKIIKLEKKNPRATIKKIIDGRESYWVRARYKKTIPTINQVRANIENIVEPDALFYNDVPLTPNSFYPFGTQPKTSDAFYIGSQEGFSKKNSNIQLSFILDSTGDPKISYGGDLLLSWEYWNGKRWNNIKKTNYQFETSSNIEFPCPSDIESTEVNGLKNYWLRIRIISGNYGIKYSNSVNNVDVKPPRIYNIKIINIYKNNQELNHILTKNNLQFTDCRQLTSFTLFQHIEDKVQSLYLGFDSPLPNGILSIFLHLKKQDYSETNKPRINWSYLKKREEDTEWAPLQVIDTTNNLTESGTIEFLGPSNLAKKLIFGKDLYWIRAEVTTGSFTPYKKTISTFFQKNIQSIPIKAMRLSGVYQRLFSQYYTAFLASHKFPYIESRSPLSVGSTPLNLMWEPGAWHSPPIYSIGPCTQEILYHPKFNTPQEVQKVPAAPKICGIYLNTIWANQTDTVNDEILGSSTGIANQEFLFSRHPVLSESVWVKEPSILGEETLEIESGDISHSLDKDVWVRWLPTEDLFDSDEKSRNYIIDRATGHIKFGDGKAGRIPPIGGIIKATYQTGGGTKGNIPTGALKNLLASISYVDKISNPVEAQGGADVEVLQRALEKAPKRIQHRNRAVAAEDYEWLAKDASRAVAIAKCIPTFCEYGDTEPGYVSVIIVPESEEDRPEPSNELIHIVERYLKEKCPITVSNLIVTSPSYLEISVGATLYIKSIDLSSSVKFEVIKTLKEFLNPLHGGPNGVGWEFGKMPCLSDIYSILHKVEGVDHVENLSMNVREVKNGVVFHVNSLKHSLRLPSYALICSASHAIEIAIGG